MKKLCYIGLLLVFSVLLLFLVACRTNNYRSVGNYVSLSNSNTIEGGSISGTGKYNKGSTVTIRAIANDGYVFEGWYDGEDLISGLAEYIFFMPEEDLVYEARWIKILQQKSILNISNYNMALGDKWLNAAVERFEQMYADTSFESGKTGVQILVNNDSYINNYTIQSSIYDIFFADNANINEEYLLDLTETLSETMTEYGEEKSITDKLGLNADAIKSSDGNYYSIPNYNAFGGIVYDRDLFAEHGINLPTTYEGFFTMCNQLVSLGITPFIWSGQYKNYNMELLLNAILANYSGKDEMMINYSLNGTANTLVSINNGSLAFDPVTAITEENGYKLFSQAGRYYALKFLEEILIRNYCSPKCFDVTISHIDAQTEFLTSKYTDKPIAMLIDGSWWHNEADEIFENMEQLYGTSASKDSRNFGYMLPRINLNYSQKRTLLNISNSEIFIKKNALNAELAKIFLKFLYTDKSLIEFTKITGIKRFAEYEIPINDYNLLAYFEKDIIYKTTNIVNIYTKANLIKQNLQYFSKTWFASINGVTYNSFLDALINEEITAEEYFNGIINYHTEQTWNSLMS